MPPDASDQDSLVGTDLTGLTPFMNTPFMNVRGEHHGLPLRVLPLLVLEKRGPRGDVGYVGRLLGEDDDDTGRMYIVDDHIAGRLIERLLLGKEGLLGR